MKFVLTTASDFINNCFIFVGYILSSSVVQSLTFNKLDPVCTYWNSSLNCKEKDAFIKNKLDKMSMITKGIRLNL